jgi:predicted transcriptional regulator
MKYNKILKPKKFDNFTIIPSYIFRDKGISVGATGLYSYLFSHTAEQEITIQFICGHFKEGRDAIAAKLNELIKQGYLERVKVTYKGKFKGYNYILKANRSLKIRDRKKPKSENPTQSNINIYNDNNIKSNITQTEKMQKAFPHFVALFDSRYHPKTDAQIKKWKVCLDRCVRIDKYSLDEIYLAVKNARQSDFWKNNFLTLTKIRNHDKNGIMYIHRFIENNKKYNKPKCYYKIKGIQEYKLYNDPDGSERLGAITKYNKLNEFNLSQFLNKDEIEVLKNFIK